MKVLKAFLWLAAGVAIALSIVTPWHFYREGYNLWIVTPRESARWTHEMADEIEDKYPGGEFARDGYWRCEQLSIGKVWVVYRANHDVTLTTRGCW